MSVREFRLPDLGEGLEEAEITEWMVSAGEQVALNQPLCRVETAKAEVEVPSPFAGTVVDRQGEVGETLPVGSVLVRIETAETAPASSTPTAERESVLVGYGVDPSHGASHRRRRSQRLATPAAAHASKPLAKPTVRKLAIDLGVDLRRIGAGSGRGGVITADDVRASLVPAAEPELVEVAAPAEAGSTIAFRGVRAAMAAKMVQSRSTIPEATCGLWVDCTRMLQARATLEDEARSRGLDTRITPFTLILRATIEALRRSPTLNAQLDEAARQILLLDQIHLGMATATPHGLMVPVIRDAHLLSTTQLAVEMSRLAAGARDRSLKPGELTGSTFTVSNFGAFGLDDGNPVINHPEAAILGVGAIKERVWAVDGALAVRSTAKFSCAFDHRIADGAEAGSFLRTLGELIEEPERLLLGL